MKTVREIIDAIKALEYLEEEEFAELQEALNNLADECGLDLESEDEDSDYYDDDDYDDDEDEEEESDY
jgi:hypothetical protein